MCGIVGYITTGDHRHPRAREHFLKYALSIDTLRGEDSTGTISVYDQFTVHMARTTLPGDRYVHTKPYQNAKNDGWATIGHNRAATAGSVKLKNAHPFRFGDIVLVHNGTLFKDGASLPTFDKFLEVDSMQIAKALSTVPPEEANDMMEKIDGAFCIVWTDRRDNSINMARNGTRSMHFTWNTRRDFLMFMSDGNHLNIINKSMGGNDARGDTIFSVDALKHLKWKKGDVTPEVTKFGPFVRPMVIKPRWPTGGTMMGGTHGGTSKKDAESRANEKWMNRSGSGSGIYSSKVEVNGKHIHVPKSHANILEGLYKLDAGVPLRFLPERYYYTHDDTRYLVFGQIYHPEWGYTEWDAVVRNVPLVAGNAYDKRDWTVYPRGVTVPVQKKAMLGSILCVIEDYDWAGFNEHQTYANETHPDVEILGPDGKFVGVKKLKKMVESGCVSCGSNLNLDATDRYVYANNDQDLLCEDCKWENVSFDVKEKL